MTITPQGFSRFVDLLTLPLIGRLPVPQSSVNRGVELLGIYLKWEGYVGSEKIPETVLMSLVLEARHRAADQEKDKVPRFRHFYHQLRGVAAETAAASRGESSTDSRVRSLLEFHHLIQEQE